MTRRKQKKLNKQWEIDEEKRIELDEQQRKRFALYDYYWIPYGFLCPGGENEGKPLTPHEQDIEDARMYILADQPLPEDLDTRLLEYKNAEIAKQYRRIERLDELGIPHSRLDGSEIVDLDILEAEMLIISDEPIPDDLKQRVLCKTRKLKQL